MDHELGDFLRARRTDATLSPPAGPSARRRVSGLRREEVAAASGISIDYYTRLEQGRETNPSDSVVEALARVLQLPPDAREHLFRLRRRHTTLRRDRSAAARGDTAVVDRMQALVAALRPQPAYVLDRLSCMVAANEEGLALFDGFAEAPARERNTCRYLLTDPRARVTFVEWEDLARGAVAHLRAANADDLQRPELHALVAELSAASTLFDECWRGHLVARRRTSVSHVRVAGDVVARRHEVLYLPEDDLRMTVWLGTGAEPVCASTSHAVPSTA